MRSASGWGRRRARLQSRWEQLSVGVFGEWPLEARQAAEPQSQSPSWRTGGGLPRAVVSVAQLANWTTRLREACSAGSGAAEAMRAQA